MLLVCSQLTARPALSGVVRIRREYRMADAAERLARWVDPQLGELVWNERGQAWSGRTEFAGRIVPFDVDPGLKDPTRQEQLAVLEPARALLAKLPAAEPELRRQAAEEVAEAVVEQQDEVELPVEKFAQSLELTHISLGESRALHYRSPEFFPGHTITVYIEADLSFGGSAVYVPGGRA